MILYPPQFWSGCKLAFFCWLACALVSFGQPALVSVAQNVVPGAMVPSTDKLLLPKPVVDGGVGLELFRLQGEGVEWSPDGKLVAYDCKHQDGYYNIHVCNPDGTGDRCLTSVDNGLPHRHAGSPTWHRSGKYIAFAAEKKEHQGGSIEAIPGFGGRSDIWVMLADGSKAWQLTHTGNTRNDGVIIPKFSHDGTKLSWTERIGAPKMLQPRAWFGDWVIKVADFIETPNGPQLENIRTFQPGARGFYEGYGFSPDDRRIVFCSDFDSQNALHSQIYAMDAVDGGNLQRLTDGQGYNEHASYSPDGKKLVWMSNVGNHNGGTDWWIMESDGTNQRRLTHFNQSGYRESVHGPVYACLTSWAPNGVQLLGGAQYSLIKQEGRILLMTLNHSK
jgi:Tol biopolymer transport system component